MLRVLLNAKKFKILNPIIAILIRNLHKMPRGTSETFLFGGMNMFYYWQFHIRRINRSQFITSFIF